MEKLLPMGSMVYLKGGNQKVMILNRGPQVKIEGQMKMFDYSAAPYPMGLSPDKVVYFNQENVDKVLFEGYFDADEERFQEVYKQWLEENATTVVKGEVKSEVNGVNDGS